MDVNDVETKCRWNYLWGLIQCATCKEGMMMRVCAGVGVEQLSIQCRGTWWLGGGWVWGWGLSCLPPLTVPTYMLSCLTRLVTDVNSRAALTAYEISRRSFGC